MKKTIKTLLVAAVAMMMGFAASATRYDGIGFSFPIDTSVSLKEKGTFNITKQYGISQDEVYVDDKTGFALKSMCGIHFCNTDHHVEGFNYESFSFDCGIGVGFAPVDTEHVTICLFGMGGITSAYSISDRRFIDVDYHHSEKYEELFVTGTVGGNVTAIYSLNNDIAFYGSCTINYVLSGKFSRKVKCSSWNHCDSVSEIKTGNSVKIIPTLGVALKF